MTIAKCIALIIAGVALAAIFMVAALLVFAVAIWILAAAADFLASLGTSGGSRAANPPHISRSAAR